MTTLVRDGLELRYDVHGESGPALLLPHLQFSWPDLLPGHDHDGMLAHLDEAVPSLLAWLDAQL